MGQTHKIGKHKTHVANRDGWTVVTYHNTDVVKIHNDCGQIVLDSGGWRTQTTKTRMNQVASEFNLEFHVHQQDWTWYVTTPMGTTEFIDGVTFMNDGDWTVRDLVLGSMK